MAMKDKLFRIMAEADLYKVDESDTLQGKMYKYKVTRSLCAWWDLEITLEGKVIEFTSFASLPKLIRTILRKENIDY